MTIGYQEIERAAYVSLQVPRIRTRREFAEQEIQAPGGKYAGLKLRAEHQPFTMLALDAMDELPWTEIVCTGPSQTGKTLSCFVIPICYHLFELREKVIAAIPDMDMARDKWKLDILPVIELTRYRELLPRGGGGNRGGGGSLVQFTHGPALKFMSAGGSDKRRAAFESRVVCFTEIDGFEGSSTTSKEADRIKQITARTRSWGQRRQIYKECTVTTKEGHIWQAYKQGTESRFVLPCWKCRNYVSPEREDFSGWQDAETAKQAGTSSRFHCPECGAAWSPEQRLEAAQKMRLVHRGQRATNKRVEGDIPETNILSLRWSAVHNVLLNEYDYGIDEWSARRETNEDNAEREMCMFVWCTPYVPPGLDEQKLGESAYLTRGGSYPKGIVPPGAAWVTVGIDIGKYQCHWAAIAFLDGQTCEVFDYGVIDVRAKQLGVENAIMEALCNFRDSRLEVGWADTEQGMRLPDQVWIDSKFEGEPVRRFVGSCDGRKYKSIHGLGYSQHIKRKYVHPKRPTAAVIHIGEQLHVTVEYRVEINADYWKTQVHRRWIRPVGKPGSMSLYTATKKNEHRMFWRHQTAEHYERQYVPGKGYVDQWIRDRKRNHWLDAVYIASAAGSFCGADLNESPRRAAAEEREAQKVDYSTRQQTTEPYLLSDRGDWGLLMPY